MTTTNTNPEPSEATKPPLLKCPDGSDGSPRLLPGDDLKLVVEFLRPLGPELARRWLGALLMVDPDEREEMVAAVEQRVVDLYAADDATHDDTTTNPDQADPLA